MDDSVAFAVTFLGGVIALAALVVAGRARRAAVSATAELARARRDRDDSVRRAQLAADRTVGAMGAVDSGVVVCDERGTVVVQNDEAARLLEPGEGGPLLVGTMHDLVKRALRGDPQHHVLDLFGPPRRSLQVVARPLREADALIGVAVVIDDITERRRLEAMRRDFVANISHELKTPIGALGLLAETLAGERDADVARRLAERMQNEALRVGRIIEDLLDLSRIESEEAPNREPVPVHLVIAEATDRLRPAAEHSGVALEVAEAPRSLTVIGDRRQLVSAVHSLVENAITYTDEGGSVRVTAGRDGQRVVIAVEDTGVGIPARDLDRVFERFYRVDRARARATGGTGLGLSIVRHVVSNHGGDVQVTSTEGVGSTFRLELPAGPAYVVPAEEAG